MFPAMFPKMTTRNPCYASIPEPARLQEFDGGEDEDRTHDLLIANQALSQLSYPPNED